MICSCSLHVTRNILRQFCLVCVCVCVCVCVYVCVCVCVCRKSRAGSTSHRFLRDNLQNYLIRGLNYVLPNAYLFCKLTLTYKSYVTLHCLCMCTYLLLCALVRPSVPTLSTGSICHGIYNDNSCECSMF